MEKEWFFRKWINNMDTRNQVGMSVQFVWHQVVTCQGMIQAKLIHEDTQRNEDGNSSLRKIQTPEQPNNEQTSDPKCLQFMVKHPVRNQQMNKSVTQLSNEARVGIWMAKENNLGNI